MQAQQLQALLLLCVDIAKINYTSDFSKTNTNRCSISSGSLLACILLVQHHNLLQAVPFFCHELYASLQAGLTTA